MLALVAMEVMLVLAGNVYFAVVALVLAGALFFALQITQIVMVVINALVVKLVIHNVIQIIKPYLYTVFHFQLGSFHYYQ